MRRMWPAITSAVMLVVLAFSAGAAYLYDLSGIRTRACLGSQEHTSQFTADDGTRLQGVLIGRGPSGVVLAHQSDQTLCGWLPFARHLAAKGFRVFPVDLPFRPFQNAGWDRDLEAAVDYLRHAGAASVVLIGASMGGAAAMVAATEISPPVDGVVNLSGERRVSGLDADTAVRRSAVPLLIIASHSDRYLNAHEARVLYAESAASEKQLQVVPGSAHGTAILDGPEGGSVRDRIIGFVLSHRRPPG